MSAAWARATRELVAKAIGEWAHERLLTPEPDGDGWVVAVGDEPYRFRAARRALDHWDVDPASVRRGSGAELDLLAFATALAPVLGLEGERLGVYLEELSGTLGAAAYKLERKPMAAAELADAPHQVVEGRMTEGHPCFVANSGRIGWGVTDFDRYAPETARGVRLPWVATLREHSVLSVGGGLSEEAVLLAELGADALARFRAVLTDQGLDPADYVLFPVHPWQWEHRIATTFAQDVALRRIVWLGTAPDDYLAQQSVRTFANVTAPDRFFVKTAMSVINMGFVRGLSAAYMEGTPAINDWVLGLVAGDPGFERFEVVRERAAAGYRSPDYAGVEASRAPYAKLLAALWREPPGAKAREGERLMTMTALLHVDADGRPLAAELVERSGLGAAEWLRRYLRAYLQPLLHAFYAHELVFMPHGENVVLVLRDHAVERVLMKDIAEEVVVMGDRELPPEVERIRAEVPDELRVLSLLTDVVDCFLRFLGALLVRAGTCDEATFWGAVAACVSDYQADHPELADAFARDDLFADSFALSCLNRLQLRDPRQMVDLDDPAGGLQLHGELENPLARFRASAAAGA